MRDVKYHNKNFCSIAGIENTFSGKYIIRDILNKLLPKTTLVVAKVQRPYYEHEFLVKSITKISSELKELKIDEDWFSLSFKYYTKEDNDSFIEIFLDIWFDYEQPAFSFFVKGQEMQLYKNLTIDRRMLWKDITTLLPSYVLFKGIEEKVLWIGKSDNLKFEEVFI